MGFFKTFFKGLGYLIFSPFILAGFALFCVYSVFVFFYESIVAIIKFFKGERLTTFTEEDEKVYVMINGPQTNTVVNNVTNNYNTTNNTDNSSHQTTTQTVINNIIVDDPEKVRELLRQNQEQFQSIQQKQQDEEPIQIDQNAQNLIETQEFQQIEQQQDFEVDENNYEKEEEFVEIPVYKNNDNQNINIQENLPQNNEENAKNPADPEDSEYLDYPDW